MENGWRTIVAGLAAVGVVSCVNAREDVDKTTSNIGWSCGSHAPSQTVTGGFATTYTSAQTYDDCFRGKVVQINNYSSLYAVGGYTTVAWGDDLPSRDDCAGSTVGAYLLRYNKDTDTWEQVISKGAHGDLIDDDIPSDITGPPRQPVERSAAMAAGAGTPKPASVITGALIPVPKDPGLFPPVTTLPQCHPPVVYFFGSEMPPQYDYRIVASARLPGGTVLRKVSFTSVAGTCGHDVGSLCCTSGEPCQLFNNCNSASKRCEECGMDGEACCSSSISPPCFDSVYSTCGADNVCHHRVCGEAGQACCDGWCNGGTCGADGKCKPPCGDLTQSCCPTADHTGSCIQGATCQLGTCRLPCGGKGLACCAGGGCDSGSTCLGGVCQVCGGENLACCGGKLPCNAPMVCQTGVCTSRPAVSPPACTTSVQVTLTTCFNADLTPSNMLGNGQRTYTGCGADANTAQVNALFSAGLDFICTSSTPKAGCCQFSTQTFNSCLCP